MEPRYPEWPGPGHYDAQEISKFPNNAPPFHTSAIRDDKLSLKRFNHNFVIIY